MGQVHDQNQEEDIREAFRVFDNVRSHDHLHNTLFLSLYSPLLNFDAIVLDLIGWKWFHRPTRACLDDEVQWGGGVGKWNRGIFMFWSPFSFQAAGIWRDGKSFMKIFLINSNIWDYGLTSSGNNQRSWCGHEWIDRLCRVLQPDVTQKLDPIVIKARPYCNNLTIFFKIVRRTNICQTIEWEFLNLHIY